MIWARAPGKLILTGEHAVVYGNDAAVVALQRYLDLRFTPQKKPFLQTVLQDLGREGASYPLHRLRDLKHQLDQHFEEFLQGRRPVHQILHRPDDLLVYTLASVAKRLPPLRGRLHTASALPLGAGMGSSAAVIAATLLIYEVLSAQTLTLSERYHHIRFCERLQHGRGSALDAAAVVYGGAQRFHQGEREALSFNDQHWYCFLHGIPQSSTGECVAAVRQRHAHDYSLWRDWQAVSQDLIQHIQHQTSPIAALNANQALLERIGVVPTAAQRCLRDLSASGAGVKISGAGSVRGEAAGMVLLYQPDEEALQHWQQRYPQYQLEPLKQALQGAHIVTGEALL